MATKGAEQPNDSYTSRGTHLLNIVNHQDVVVVVVVIVVVVDIELVFERL